MNTCDADEQLNLLHRIVFLFELNFENLSQELILFGAIVDGFEDFRGLKFVIFVFEELAHRTVCAFVLGILFENRLVVFDSLRHRIELVLVNLPEAEAQDIGLVVVFVDLEFSL